MRTGPGATAFTRIPSAARLRARFFVMLVSAALLAVYPISALLWCCTETAVMLTIRAPFGPPQQGEGVADAADRRERALVEHPHPGLIGHVLEPSGPGGPYSIDQGVDCAPGRFDFPKRGGNLVVLGCIRSGGLRLPALRPPPPPPLPTTAGRGYGRGSATRPPPAASRSATARPMPVDPPLTTLTASVVMAFLPGK